MWLNVAFLLYRKGMGFDSIGSLVVVAIVVLVFFGLVPQHTRTAIERSRKHEEDRFSTSLHLVELEQQAGLHGARGIHMQMQQQQQRRIDAVRAARRAAIKRRQILVGSLLLVTVALLVAGYFLHFSLLWALIPVVLIVAVLGLGMRAARVARAWESQVSRDSSAAPQTSPARREVTTPEPAHLSDDAHEVLESAPTYVIPVDDVREVLRQQALDKQAALDAKSHTAVTEVSDDGDDDSDIHSDVHDSPAEKALLSFTLGADEAAESVKSAEIKSYRQVAKAVPVETATPEKAAVEVPVASVDSLGVDVDAIIARRQH